MKLTDGKGKHCCVDVKDGFKRLPFVRRTSFITCSLYTFRLILLSPYLRWLGMGLEQMKI
ncbi:hypothetical protein BC829DRAFT_385676 [Chytridium lagenaria]|nr:hypothetical protein BC829DRAFT_385676 [Chytridium lagenaria]